MPLGLTKKFGSFRGKKPADQDSPGGSLGSCDPDVLHNLPIGGELKVDDKGNVVGHDFRTECVRSTSDVGPD
jgi:hypothetical protein